MAYAQSRRFDPYKPFPASANLAEKIAHQVDEADVNDWMFRRPILNKLPDRLAVPVIPPLLIADKSRN